MISSRRHRRMGFKARLWLSGSAVWWWRGRRKEWRRVVGAGRALGEARRRIRVILHTSWTVDAGGCASVILIYIPGVTAAVIVNAPPIQTVQIRGRLWTRELLLSFGLFGCTGFLALALGDLLTPALLVGLWGRGFLYSGLLGCLPGLLSFTIAAGCADPSRGGPTP